MTSFAGSEKDDTDGCSNVSTNVAKPSTYTNDTEKLDGVQTVGVVSGGREAVIMSKSMPRKYTIKPGTCVDIC